MADVSTLQIEIDSGRVMAGIDAIERNLAGLARQVGQVDRSMGQMQGGVASAFGGLKVAAGAAAAAFAAIGLGKLGGEIIQINREFGKLQASLVTVTGSTEKADAAFAALQEFAAKTPYSLQEVTGAFIKMRSYGLETSEEALTSFGNTASAMGKSLDQMVEAVADATTGEFERLKEFGIKSQKVGDDIIFTFQGVQTTVKNNADAIQGYLETIGNTKFGGAMERQAQEIDGALSNLSDTAQGLAYSFGEGGFNDAFVDFIKTIEGGLGSLKPFAAELGRMAGESLTSLTNGLKSAAQGIQDFLADTNQIGGVTATNGEIFRATLDVMKEKAKSAFTNMVAYVEQWGKAYGEVGGKVFKFFGDNWSSISDYVKFAVVAWTEYIYTFFSVIGTFLKNLPSLFVATFSSAGAVISEFAKAARDSLLNGNLDAFKGFSERINQGFTDAWGKVFEEIGSEIETGSEVIKTAFDQIGTESGVQMNSRLIEMAEGVVTEIADKIVENKAEAEAAGAAVGEGAGKSLNDALRDETKKTPSILQEAGLSVETFKTRMEGLISTYLPTTARTQELQRAIELVGIASKMSKEELEKYGLTQEMVARISEKLIKEQGNVLSFFQQQVDNLNDERNSILRQAVGSAQYMTEERINQIKRYAEAVHEDLSDAEAAALGQLILRNEQLKKTTELEKQRFSIINDMEREVKLLQYAGKEREKMAKLLDFERRARDAGVDKDEIARQTEVLRREMDEIDAAREKFNTFSVGARDAMVEYAESAKDIASQAKEGMESIIGSLEDSLADFIKTGKFNMSSFLDDIASMLAKFAAKRAVAAAFDFLGFGGSGGFGGFFADGGRPPLGKVSIVGEEGPELFVPDSAGTIVPNHLLKASGGSNSVAVNMSFTLQGDGRNFDQAALDDFRRQVMTETLYVVQDELRHGGILAR